MDWIIPRSREGGVNLVWFHNLNFDLRSVFYENLREIYDQYNDIRFDRDGYVVKLLFGRVNHATIWEDKGGYLCPKCPEPVPARRVSYIDGKKVCTSHSSCNPAVRRNLGIKVQFLDSAAFCPPGSKSLEAALRIYDVAYRKMRKPDGLGTQKLFNDVYFRKYSLNDARAEHALGCKIVALHKEYDVCISVSLPQLAARILRHHFFLPKETLKFPPEAARLASELSYHAGKNGFYVRRGVYDNVYEYDINSAFPRAMRELPQLVKGNYENLRRGEFKKNYLGVYRISGTAHGARYPALFDHSFIPIKEGRFKKVWVTGFEVEILRNNAFYDFEIERGYIWRPEKYSHSPLASFVDRFWRLKNTTPKGAKRDTYKNILNSLYGKFAACVEKRPMVETAFGPSAINDPKADNGKYFVAGALYHPFIATQITGYVRREIYKLEVQGRALHTATDSIKSFKKLPTSDNLGGLKLEVFGRCYLFRTKLYLHFGKTTEHCGHDLSKPWVKLPGGRKVKIFDGQDRQHLCKYALHGFKGNVLSLYKNRHKLLNEGRLDYEFQHMVSLREGFKRDEPVSCMVKRRETLSLTKGAKRERNIDKVG